MLISLIIKKLYNQPKPFNSENYKKPGLNLGWKTKPFVWVFPLCNCRNDHQVANYHFDMES